MDSSYNPHLTKQNFNLEDEAGASSLRAHLAPTALSQYVGLDNCERYLWFYLHKPQTDRLTKQLARQAELSGTPWLPVQPLSPLLEGLGNRIEQNVVATLEAQGYPIQDLGTIAFEGALELLQNSYSGRARLAPHYLYQLPLAGSLGGWRFEGRADLVRFQRDENAGALKALVIDVKASRKDKVQHRLQIAVYVRLLRQMLAQAGIKTVTFEGAIVRRLATGELQDPAEAVSFDLEPYLATVRYLTGDNEPDDEEAKESPRRGKFFDKEASPLAKVAATSDYTRLHYYLGPRCDGCVFSPVCLTESAQRQDLSLIPYLESPDKRVLNQAGIFTLEDLASLKRFVELPAPAAVTNSNSAEPVLSGPKPAFSAEPLDEVTYHFESDEAEQEAMGYATAPLELLNGQWPASTIEDTPTSIQPDNGKATSPKTRLQLAVAPGKEALVERLSKLWPLAPRLDRLIQRAARARQNFDKTTPAHRFFIDRTPYPPRSNLPDDRLYPNLIKIFVEAQHDYLEDRLYLLAALIKSNSADGQTQEKAVIRLSEDVPTAQSERQLIVEWVGQLFGALAEIMSQDRSGLGAPVHLYLYNRHDQKVLLDALRRHLDGLAVLPVLYRLLTATPALTQPALAFLDEEVRERLNLSGPLASLTVVSRQLGFKWNDEQGNNFARLFRSGVFDYGLRRNDGVYIHTTARFHSSIPLEYAYAVWNRLESATNLSQTRTQENTVSQRYRAISRAQLEAFARHRLHALAHIEASFPYKNSFITKEPLPLNSFGLSPSNESEGEALPQTENKAGTELSTVLEEFLHIEQYSSLQEHLALFARPILRRLEEGRALLVRATGNETTTLSRRRKQIHATFLAEFGHTGVHPETALQISKLKEGDFVVVSPLENDGQPWKIVGGRLARIEELTGEWVKLELSGSTLGPGQTSAFRYHHTRELLPQPGQYYLIDEMVDNLNGDKLLEACRQSETNILYRWLLSERNSSIPPTPIPGRSPNQVSTGENPGLKQFVLAQLQEFTRHLLVVEKAQNRLPTADQLEVITGQWEQPLLLVQGPPGTGKSHTLGWAVLARLYLALARNHYCRQLFQEAAIARASIPDSDETSETATATEYFRVIVSSQTHNAVEIVLQSIAEKVQLLENYLAQAEDKDKMLELLLQNLKLFKIGGDEQASRSPLVGYVDPWEREQVVAALDGTSQDETKPAKKKKSPSGGTKRKTAPSLQPETTPPAAPQNYLAVLGATPGNLYNLMKEYYGRGKKVQDELWQHKDFELVVLDEASQLNLPHALLATGWLKPEGQLLVVGDHRQLSPILAHGWEDEEHLSIVSSRPYRSIFQYLLDSGWPRIALNESFRLHQAQAAFLQAQIYHQDGIHFHSRQQKRLPALSADDKNEENVPRVSRTAGRAIVPAEFVKAALHPDYPLVVIEHTEAISQQYNQLEVELVSPIVQAAITRLGLEGQQGIGIVVPHRAQKALLRERFPTLAKAGAIDTVERFQGGERDLIIVSMTVSDPDYLAAEAEFILSPNRFNVALSRPRAKLILVASRSLVQFVSARLDLFERSLLWKRLLAVCQDECLWSSSLEAENNRRSDRPHFSVSRPLSATAQEKRSAIQLNVFAHRLKSE